MNEFEDQMEWKDDSIEDFCICQNYGFIEPAMLAVITGLIGEISLFAIAMHI